MGKSTTNRTEFNRRIRKINEVFSNLGYRFWGITNSVFKEKIDEKVFIVEYNEDYYWTTIVYSHINENKILVPMYRDFYILIEWDE